MIRIVFAIALLLTGCSGSVQHLSDRVWCPADIAHTARWMSIQEAGSSCYTAARYYEGGPRVCDRAQLLVVYSSWRPDVEVKCSAMAKETR